MTEYYINESRTNEKNVYSFSNMIGNTNPFVICITVEEDYTSRNLSPKLEFIVENNEKNLLKKVKKYIKKKECEKIFLKGKKNILSLILNEFDYITIEFFNIDKKLIKNFIKKYEDEDEDYEEDKDDEEDKEDEEDSDRYEQYLSLLE